MSENKNPPARRRRTDAYQPAAVPQQSPSALKKDPPPAPVEPKVERNTQERTVLRDTPVIPAKPPVKKEKNIAPAADGNRVRGTKEHTKLKDSTKPTPKLAAPDNAQRKTVADPPASRVSITTTGYRPQLTGNYQPRPGQTSAQPVYPGQNPYQGQQGSVPPVAYPGRNPYQGQPSSMQPVVYPGQNPYQGQPSSMYPAYPGQAPYQGQPTGAMPNYPPRTSPPQPMSGTGRMGYIPPVPPVPPQPPVASGNGNGNGNGKPPFRMPKALIWLLIAVIVGLLGYVIINGIRQQQEREAFEAAVHAYDNVFCEGVYVDGVNLSGMTRDQAQSALVSHAEKENSSWSVELTYGGEVQCRITTSDLNISFDVNDALNEAWAQGHTGTVDERSAAMDSLRQQPYQAYSADPNKDTSGIDDILGGLRTRFYQVPHNAVLVAFNPGATDPFTIQPEIPGRSLDIEPIRRQLYQMVSTMTSGSITLEPVAIQPDITTADVRATVTLRGTAYTEISTTSTENRNNNIRRAFERISGTILHPGKTFSFNNIVGERSTANGFYEAPEIVYRETTSGIGGGVCQASTTIYQAAIRAGMTINERTPHSEKANYCDYGMDATVYWYSNHRKDLKFTNNSDGDIYIVCSVQSNPNNRKRLITKVDIYGKSLGNTKYELVNELVEELPYVSETRRDKDRKYVTYVDEQFKKTEGADGFVYNSYRVTYVDGQETERALLFKDTYEPRNEVIYVGTVNRD